MMAEDPEEGCQHEGCWSHWEVHSHSSTCYRLSTTHFPGLKSPSLTVCAMMPLWFTLETKKETEECEKTPDIEPYFCRMRDEGRYSIIQTEACLSFVNWHKVGHKSSAPWTAVVLTPWQGFLLLSVVVHNEEDSM